MLLPYGIAAPELLTPVETAAADRAAATAGVPGRVLMENAGRAVARVIARYWRPCRVLALCGPGNNGGDGYVAARVLAGLGWPVAVAAFAPPRPESDAATAALSWHGPLVPFTAERAAEADLVIDAVFGSGLKRDVEDPAAAALAAARCVVAVDIPSGVDGASGACKGFAPRAERTVTFFRRKPGHLLLPGREHCGIVHCQDIGLPEAVLGQIRPATFANGPALWTLPKPGAADHKYSRGYVTVLAGAMTGAALLAAAGARRAGAGMVSLAPLGAPPASPPGLILSPAPLSVLLADPRRTVWVCGPGLGVAAARALLPQLLAAGCRVVADADALMAASSPGFLRGVAVLTPHAGEFARVFGPPGPDRLAAVRAAAAATAAVVVLKGADSIVAAPDSRAVINDNAPPDLAVAGAGDVLSGIIAALLAQGLAPFSAAAAAVWLHGRAASLAGPGLLAEDLSAFLPAAAAEARADPRHGLYWREKGRSEAAMAEKATSEREGGK